MKALKSFLDFFLYSNIFISLCACAMTVETYLLVHSEINRLYAGFIFSSSVVLYNYPSLFLAGEDQHSERSKWILENKKIIWLISIPALIATSVLIFFFPLKLILWFVPVSVLSFAYFLPITNLRAIPVLKAVVVALVWTCITFYFPMMFSPLSTWRGVGGEIRFFFLLPLAIAFNIRDIESDRKANVKTLLVIYGVRVTKILCLVFLFIFSALVLFAPHVPIVIGMKIKISLLISAVVTSVLILFSSELRSEYFYSLWMDGMILLQVILVIFVS